MFLSTPTVTGRKYCATLAVLYYPCSWLPSHWKLRVYIAPQALLFLDNYHQIEYMTWMILAVSGVSRLGPDQLYPTVTVRTVRFYDFSILFSIYQTLSRLRPTGFVLTVGSSLLRYCIYSTLNWIFFTVKTMIYAAQDLGQLSSEPLICG